MPHWIKLRSGLLDHLPGMSDAACKLFTWLCLQAPIRGPQAGVVETTVRRVAEGCGWGRNKSSETMAELEKSGYITIKRPRNPSGNSTVVIRKFIQNEGADASATADTLETDASSPADARVRHSGRVRPASPEKSTTSEPLRDREEDKREENSPLPPSLDDPGWGEEITADTLFADYPAHQFGLQQARIAFQQQFGLDEGFLADLPAIRAACRRAIELCPPDRRKYLPGLPKVLAGEWRELEARAEHQRDHQPANPNRPPAATSESLEARRRQLEELRKR